MTGPEPAVPPQATHLERAVTAVRTVCPDVSQGDVLRMLEAAAPHLVAAERERCAQLAQDRAATCVRRDANGDMVGVMSFADLLRQGGEGGGT